MAVIPTKHFDEAAAPRSGSSVEKTSSGLIGSYRIVRPLGRGGMAVVYLAEHIATGERVALKTVEGANAALRWGIRREIHALRRVEHPGVVRILDEGVDGDRPWYAMEFVEGRTLFEHTACSSTISLTTLPAALQRTGIRGAAPNLHPEPIHFQQAANGALPEILRLVREVCDALAFVHGMGLVHRDLKPDNIMVRADGSPVLVDFGLAMQLRGPRGRDVLEMGHRYIGTPAYMAPEQIDDDLMDARVDLYALGCILYEGVTGRVPFLGTTDSVLHQHLHDLPERPSARVEGVPPELDALILTLLRKRPGDRPGYADDVAAALQRLGAGDAAPARRTEPHLYRPRLAGRASALAILDTELKNVRVGRGGRVLVGGESGVGKTRFAREVGVAASRRGIWITTGECISVSGAAPDAAQDVKAASLHPLLQLLSTIADHCREQGFEETERVFGARGPALAVHEPSIGQLPGQELYPQLGALSASAARAQFNTSMAGALAAFAQLQPVLLVIEDLQWVDEASMAFLRSLDEDYFARARVLILGTWRTEETSESIRGLLGEPGVTRLDLGRLDDAAVTRMVGDMIAIATPPAPLLEFLIARSEGHPFFVTEYLRMAVRERMLFRGDAGDWQVQNLDGHERSRFESLALPDELRALVSQRVAALGKGAFATARMAAVFGREVDLGVLASAMSLDEIAHFEAVEELRARQIVDLDDGRLRFAHDKLREIIHGTIDAEERRRLHAAAGAAIEARYAGTPGLAAVLSELVHHFTSANDPEQAFTYLVEAGRAALAVGSSGEALTSFRQALSIDDARPIRSSTRLSQLDRASLEAQLGRAALNQGLLPEAERHLRAARARFLDEPRASLPTTLNATTDLARQLLPQAILLLGRAPPATSNPTERRRLTGAAQTSDRLAEIYYIQQDWLRAFTAALQTVNIASGLGVSVELVRAYGTLAFSTKTLQLFRLSARYEVRAREAAAALGDPEALGWVWTMVGMAAMAAASFGEARTSLELALTCAQQVQETRYIELVMVLLAIIESTTGRPAEARKMFERITALGRKSGSRQTQVWALAGEGLCALALDDAPQAIALFERRRIVGEDYRDDPVEWINHGMVAEAYAHTGDDERALATAERTLQHIEKIPLVGFTFFLGYIATGEVLFDLWERATEPKKRAAAAQRARRMYWHMRRFSLLYALGRPSMLRFRGLLDALSGRLPRARRAFTLSFAEAERCEMPFEQACALYELGRHGAPDDPGRASSLADARAIFAGLGQLRWLARVDAVIAQIEG